MVLNPRSYRPQGPRLPGPLGLDVARCTVDRAHLQRSSASARARLDGECAWPASPGSGPLLRLWCLTQARQSPTVNTGNELRVRGRRRVHGSRWTALTDIALLERKSACDVCGQWRRPIGCSGLLSGDLSAIRYSLVQRDRSFAVIPAHVAPSRSMGYFACRAISASSGDVALRSSSFMRGCPG